MKKYLVTLLIFLLFLGGMFAGVKVEVARAETENALFGAMVLWDATVQGLPQGWRFNIAGVNPVLYTEIPMDYPHTKSLYVVFGDDNKFYISEDKSFDDPATSPDEVAVPGDYITFGDEDRDGNYIIKDEMGNIITQSGKYVPFVGRTFQIGWVDFGDSNGDHIANFPTDLNGADPTGFLYYNNAGDNNIGDIFLIYEVVDTTKTYDAFVVSDAGRMVIPYPPPVQSPPMQVKFGDTITNITWIPGQDWGYARFYGVSINYRGFSTIEWWFDNGENNVTGGPALPGTAFADQSDNFSLDDMTCERFLGGTDSSLHENDYGMRLYPFLSSEMFYDLDGGGTYNYKEAIYRDNGDGTVSVGDERLTPVSSENMGSGFAHSYPEHSIVQAGDEDVGLTLTSFAGLTVKHTGNPTGYSYESWTKDAIYDDVDNSGDVTGGDVRISGTDEYSPGSTVQDPLPLDFEDPIDGIAVNKRNTERYSLVGVSTEGVDIEIVNENNENTLMVEGIVDIKVRYSPGIRGWVVLTFPDGYSIYRLIPESGEVEFDNISLWRGGKLTFRVFADNVEADGLPDGVYGTWNQRNPPSTVDIPSEYDYYFIKRYDILPEEIQVYLDRECIHPYDSTYPNIYGWARDPYRYGIDPEGTIVGTNVYIGYNASTESGSIMSIMTVEDSGSNLYFLQFNQANRSGWLWDWTDNDTNGYYSVGDSVSGPTEVNNIKYVDENENGIIDVGDTIRDIYTDSIVYTVVHNDVYTEIDENSGKFPLFIKGTGVSCEDINVVVSTYQVVYDANNIDPNYQFIFDPANPSSSGFNEEPPHVWVMAVDYRGEVKIKSEPINPYINFVNFKIVDNALRNSPYPNPYPPYGSWVDLNSNGIADPGEMTSNQYPFTSKWLRAYPGGQTNLLGSGYLYDETDNPGTGPSPVTSLPNLPPWGFNGFNARHAQFAWLDKNPPYKNYLFEKLGTAMHPFTDYNIEFTLTDGEGNLLAPTDIKYLDLIGEKVDERGQAVFVIRLPDGPYTYDGISNLPKRYLPIKDKLHLISNSPSPFNLGDYYDTNEEIWSFNIIPTSWGKIRIKVADLEGHTNEYKYCSCCFDSPPGIDVLGIEINDAPTKLTVNEETEFTVQLKEYSDWQVEKKVNNALVFVWQDRGVYDPERKVWYGVGDGWITGGPYVSQTYNNYVPFPYTAKDWNDDGVISFDDGETEIMGDFDIASGTWSVKGTAWVVEQTFQVNDGLVTFKIKPNDVGFDFNGDGVVDRLEELPVRITAYQYANDGSFSYNSTYDWMLPNLNPDMPIIDGTISPWEVFISGEAFIPVVPQEGINVEVEPQPLTAGAVQECLEGKVPLTFTVDTDLTKGISQTMEEDEEIEVEDDTIWKYLIEDPHPDPLPTSQNYWMRTDLHNDDQYGYPIHVVLPDGEEGLIGAGNTTIYDPAFRPIEFRRDGNKFIFKNFVANDKGEFKVYFYSPDREKYGVVTVKVELPHIKWEIKNREDENGTVFEDDFVLTAGDNRIYDITGTVYDAQGNLITGPCSECGSEQKCPTRVTVFSSYTPHYPNFIIKDFDFDDNEEAIDFSWLYLNYPDDPISPSGDVWEVIYNETYNYDKWNYGHLFFDNPMKLDGNRITSADSFVPDCNGQIHFAIYPTDIGYISALVGVNPFYDDNFGDLGGYLKRPFPEFNSPPYPHPEMEDKFSEWELDESSRVYTKFEPDRLFSLDWDAHADSKIEIGIPKAKVYSAETGEELPKSIFSKDNYDLTYAVENWLKIEMLPADERDLPIKFGQIQIVGNDGVWIYGTYDKDVKTDLVFKPHGTGERVATLVWSCLDKTLRRYMHINESTMFQFIYDDTPPLAWFNILGYMPWNLVSVNTHLTRVREIQKPVTAYELPRFDSARGLGISWKSDEEVTVGKEIEVTFFVKVLGSNEPVEGATVQLYGGGVSTQGVTDAEGKVTLLLTPTTVDPIYITAVKDGFIMGKKVLNIVKDTTPPVLEVNDLPKLTNSETISVSGKVSDETEVVSVTVNGTEATVNEDGTFETTITLVEGKNPITVIATDMFGNVSKKEFVVEADFTPPEIVRLNESFIFEPDEKLNAVLTFIVDTDFAKGKAIIEGEEYEGVKVGDDTLLFNVVFPHTGMIQAIVEVEDKAGNVNQKLFVIPVQIHHHIELVIGLTQILVDGEYITYEVAPYIKNKRTMVPLRLIAETFGADVEWIPETKSINITFKDHQIGLQIGNNQAIIDGDVVLLDVVPEIVNGRTFVPIRFIAETFGADVKWIYPERKVVIDFVD